jgi:ribosomal protein S21
VQEIDDFNYLVKCWRKAVKKEGILGQLKFRRTYIKPGDKRRAKAVKALARRRKEEKRRLKYGY